MVNNAGVAIFTEIEWCSVTQFQRIMDVNVFGVVRVTKAFLPIVRQVNGRIVNVASLAGTYYMSFAQRMCVCVGGGVLWYPTHLGCENYLGCVSLQAKPKKQQLPTDSTTV